VQRRGGWHAVLSVERQGWRSPLPAPAYGHAPAGRALRKRGQTSARPRWPGRAPRTRESAAKGRARIRAGHLRRGRGGGLLAAHRGGRHTLPQGARPRRQPRTGEHARGLRSRQPLRRCGARRRAGRRRRATLGHSPASEPARRLRYLPATASTVRRAGSPHGPRGTAAPPTACARRRQATGRRDRSAPRPANPPRGGPETFRHRPSSAWDHPPRHTRGSPRPRRPHRAGGADRGRPPLAAPATGAR